jgi:hypothetical protein
MAHRRYAAGGRRGGRHPGVGSGGRHARLVSRSAVSQSGRLLDAARAPSTPARTHEFFVGTPSFVVEIRPTAPATRASASCGPSWVRISGCSAIAALSTPLWLLPIGTVLVWVTERGAAVLVIWHRVQEIATRASLPCRHALFCSAASDSCVGERVACLRHDRLRPQGRHHPAAPRPPPALRRAALTRSSPVPPPARRLVRRAHPTAAVLWMARGRLATDGRSRGEACSSVSRRSSCGSRWWDAARACAGQPRGRARRARPGLPCALDRRPRRGRGRHRAAGRGLAFRGYLARRLTSADWSPSTCGR